MLILSHIYSVWCSIYFTSSVSPDHSGGGPSPTVTHPHLLHLAGSLMQNEALTLYQSVKALFVITPISWTHSVINVQILFPPIANGKYEGMAFVRCSYDLEHEVLWIFLVIVFKGVTREHRNRQREDKWGCDRESCEKGRMVHSGRDRFLFRWKWGLMLVGWEEGSFSI